VLDDIVRRVVEMTRPNTICPALHGARHSMQKEALCDRQ
jgi:hypothetical protein